MTTEEKNAIMKEFAQKEGDVGSPQVQIAVLTAKIKELTSHMKEHPKDYSSRRGLLTMVTRRKSLLKYVNSKNHSSYVELVKKLGLKR
ncbi:MAG: 30S ribosomal protein S15 [Lentisphaeraceae bacterium]|nr:30S ribosomal protein S15 [Lentisphaeraceae bacterium]